MVSSDYYANGLRAKGLADTATNLVMAQIRRATEEPKTVWVSQPGAVRTYNDKGEFSFGYKLWSDDAMLVTEPKQLVDDGVAPDWNSAENSAHWVDLNAPMVREAEAYFPILNPAALEREIEGFDFEEGVVAGEPDRMPMPVRWIYVLKDGTLGSLGEDSHFVAAPGSAGVPSKSNPIVGRVAFWADDESCKVNLNTASEPTPWDVPRSAGPDDRDYALFQPTKGEYQRFPGHPATTALSPILKPLPKAEHGPGTSTSVLSVHEKNRIYDLVPRIEPGGSRSATLDIGAIIELSKEEVGGGTVRLDRDRLFPSIDELVFAPNLPGAISFEPRKSTQLLESTGNAAVVGRRMRESRFFLTTHSRAPEVNSFGMPRVSMWPTSEVPTGDFGKMRTPYDDLIRFCATTGGEDKRLAYHFERGDSRSATHDILEISRNKDLYRYLQKLTSKKLPGYGSSLSDKWQEDRDQILTEVFDYIRCTNLYDDQLSKRAYNIKDYDDGKKLQYTDGRPSAGSLSSWPGHGQVVPIEIPSEDGDTRGFGRFYTLSEAGILFICCADAGGPADQEEGEEEAEAAPKYPKGIMGSNQPVGERDGGRHERGKNNALPRKLDWQEDKQERCLQAALLLELFCPSQGWTHLHEDMTIEIEMINPFTVNGETLKFNLDEDVWQSAGDAKIGNRRMGAVGEASQSSMSGGTVGFWTLADDRYAPKRGTMAEDVGMRPKASDRKKARSDDNRRVYPFISEPFIVNGNPEPGENIAKMQMGDAEMKVHIRLGTAHGPSAADVEDRLLVQTLTLKFPGTRLPVPELAQVRIHRDLQGGPEELEEGGYKYEFEINVDDKGRLRRRRGGIFHPSFWWSLSRDGIGIGDPKHGHHNYARWRDVEKPDGWDEENEGEKWVPKEEEFVGQHFGRMIRFGRPDWTFVNLSPNPNIRGRDVVRTLVPEHRDYRLIAGVKEVPEEVFVPHKDYFNSAVYLAHHLSGFVADSMRGRGYHRNAPGLVGSLKEDNPRERLERYHPSRKPDFPVIDEEGDSEPQVQLFGDFDNGISIMTDGAYINKPDEGNRLSRKIEEKDDAGNVVDSWQTVPYYQYAERDQGGIPAFFSPSRQVSSSGMFGSLPTGVKRGQPWQTLLFRPQKGHPGDAVPTGSAEDGGGGTRGSQKPPDHALMDLFWMPVVEPYAISEPFSTAGKINLNYQILPFTYLKRSTGMHSILKSEEILAIPINRAISYKRGAGLMNTKIRRLIDPDETLRQFEARFDKGEVFRMANEICDVHLVPEYLTLEAMTEDFWDRHALTGDNTRERPYANIYPRITTQSNIFRVHCRAQVIRKARGTNPAVFDVEKDTAAAEYRGSQLIERYIDPADEDIPDYAGTDSSPEPLSEHYKFRIISSERFAP